MINTILWAFKTSAGHHDHVKAETPGNSLQLAPSWKVYTERMWSVFKVDPDAMTRAIVAWVRRKVSDSRKFSQTASEEQ